MAIHYTGQRHRGACSATEEGPKRRKYATKRRNMSSTAQDKAMAESYLSEQQAEQDAFAAFESGLALVAGKRLHTIQELQTIYLSTHPRAKVS